MRIRKAERKNPLPTQCGSSADADLGARCLHRPNVMAPPGLGPEGGRGLNRVDSGQPLERERLVMDAGDVFSVHRFAYSLYCPTVLLACSGGTVLGSRTFPGCEFSQRSQWNL